MNFRKNSGKLTRRKPKTPIELLADEIAQSIAKFAPQLVGRKGPVDLTSGASRETVKSADGIAAKVIDLLLQVTDEGERRQIISEAIDNTISEHRDVDGKPRTTFRMESTEISRQRKRNYNRSAVRKWRAQKAQEANPK